MNRIPTYLKVTVVLLLLLPFLPVQQPETARAAEEAALVTYFPLIYNNIDVSAVPASEVSLSQVGPEGGTVPALVIDPKTTNILYAGTWGGGVAKSTDGGDTWTLYFKGLRNRYIQSLAIDPNNTSIVYAGTYGDGVFKSMDGGQTWNPTGPGLNPSPVVYALVVDPRDPSILYAGTRSLQTNGDGLHWGGGAYKTTTGGDRWFGVNNDLGAGWPNGPEGWVYSLAIDPITNDVYAATHSQGIYYTDNGGNQWYIRNKGLNDTWTRSVAIDPKQAGAMYAGTWHGSEVNPASGLYKSTDYGKTWDPVPNNAWGKKVYTLAVDPINTQNIYAGMWESNVFSIYKSVNYGMTWNPIGPAGVMGVYALKIDPANPKNIYVGTETGGVYKSTDGGKTWSIHNHQLYAGSITSLAIDPGSPAKLFAGTNMSGVPIGAIEGSQVTWSNTGSWIDQVKINKLLVDPESASTLYAGVGGDSSISGGVYKSLDYGATWSKQSLGISSLSSSDQPAVKLADIPSSPQSSAEATDATMKSLSTLTNSIVMDLLADASAPGTLYAATSSGVYKTSDGGGLWALASAGLPAGWVNALAADPADPAVMYAATGSGVYKSADSAKSWSPTAYTGTSVLSLAFTRLSPDTLFAGTDGKGVVKSADGGVTWTRADNGLEGAVVFALAADPAHSETLYAGTGNGYDNSVFRTTDGGNSWLHVVMDLGNTDVFNLALDPKDSSVLYAGTNGRGIFRLQFQAAP